MLFVFCATSTILLLNLGQSQVIDPLIGWTEPSTPLMPYASSTLFAGYQPSTDRIWLIGGPNELIMSYTIGLNRFDYWNIFTTLIDLNVNSINAQISAQWGDNDIMFVYNGILRSFSFNTYGISSYQPLTYNRQAPCVAVSYPNYIFAVGGSIVSTTDPENIAGDDSRYVQIYNYEQSTWTKGPNMNDGRTRHACVIHGDYLYVFGGLYYHTTNYNWYVRPSSEKLYIGNIANINSYTWQPIAYVQNSNTAYHRAVVHGLYNHIYLIGGRDWFNGNASRKVQIYDTVTDTIELDNNVGRLNTGRSSAVSIIVKNVLYVFGGSNTASAAYNTWEKTNILTFSPTNAPTSLPTISPTKFPTNIPTISPTNIPTITPTNLPTTQPSTTPTNIPTTVPTSPPSKFPTNIPSVSPSKNPTSITVTPTYISNAPTMSPETGLQVISPTSDGYVSTNEMETQDPNENGSIINNSKGGDTQTLFYIILIIIATLLAVCMLLSFYIVFRHRKKMKIIQNQKDNIENIQMTTTHINENVTMSEHKSDNDIIDGIKVTTTAPLDMQRVASMSGGINTFVATPFGDLLDDNNSIYNENSGLQKVISMSSHVSIEKSNNIKTNTEAYDEDDDMYDKGNDNHNIELKTQGHTNNGLRDDNYLSDEGTNSEVSDKSSDSSDGNRDTIKTTQGQLTTVS